MVIGITRKDVENLNVVYWWANEIGAPLFEMSESLRNVEYFCSGKLDESTAPEQGFEMKATFRL